MYGVNETLWDCEIWGKYQSGSIIFTQCSSTWVQQPEALSISQSFKPGFGASSASEPSSVWWLWSYGHARPPLRNDEAFVDEWFDLWHFE